MWICNLYNKWCLLPDKLRFLLVGGFNVCFSYLLYILFIYLLGEQYYQICVALQWSVSSVFSFFNQKVFVFCTKGRWVSEYLKCCTSWLISYTVNALVLEFVVHNVTDNVYIGQIISVMLAAVVTYNLLKRFAFKIR